MKPSTVTYRRLLIGHDFTHLAIEMTAEIEFDKGETPEQVINKLASFVDEYLGIEGKIEDRTSELRRIVDAISNCRELYKNEAEQWKWFMTRRQKLETVLIAAQKAGVTMPKEIMEYLDEHIPF